MKAMIIMIGLVAALSLFASAQAESIPADDVKSDVAEPHDIKPDESQPARDRDHEGNKTGNDLKPTESGTHNKEKSPPEKKPRLKYRDEPGCSC